MSDETIQTGTEQPSPQPGAYQKYASGEFEVESNVRSADEIRDNFEKSEPLNKDAPQKTEDEQKAEDTSKAASELAKRGAEKRQEQPKEPKGEEKPKAEAKEEKPDEEKPKPRKDPNARVQQVTREMAKLRQEHEETKRELERLKASRAPAETGEDPEPDVSKYPDTPEGARDYIKAQARWEARQERLSQHQKEAEQTEKLTRQEQQQARELKIKEGVAQFHDKLRAQVEADPEFENRVRDFAESHPPTWVLSPNERPGVANYLANDIILNQPNPAQIMDHLAQNPDVLEDLEGTTNPRQFHRKLDALSLRLESEVPQKVEAEPSKARPPIKPVSGSAQVSDPYDLSDNLSDDEWMDRRMALARKKRAG